MTLFCWLLLCVWQCSGGEFYDDEEKKKILLGLQKVPFLQSVSSKLNIGLEEVMFLCIRVKSLIL